MFSIHTAASIYYYLGIQPGHEAETALFGKDSERGSTTYYQNVDASDPLFEAAVWTGKLAATVGLKPGSVVRPGDLASMWFGMHPRTRKPLDRRGLSFQSQIKAQKALAEADTELYLATRAMASKRQALKVDGLKPKEINTSPEVRNIQDRIDSASKAVKEATSSKCYRAGPHDATFSAPKSVSILWARLKADTNPATMARSQARAKAIEAAMLASSKAVIDGYIEPNMIFTRDKAATPDDGGHSDQSNVVEPARTARKKNLTTYENVTGLATALFLHYESRPTSDRLESDSKSDASKGPGKLPDPQLHVHGLLMSMGISQDDDVRAIWTTFLGGHAKAIGAAFRGELAMRLRELELDLRMDVQANISGFELAGIDEDQIGEFSSRRAQVKGNLDRGQDSETAVLSGREVKRDYTGNDLLKAWDRRLSAANIKADLIEAASVHSVASQMAAKACGSTLEQCDTASTEFQRHYDTALAKLTCRPPTVSEAIAQLLAMESSITLEAITKLSFEASQYCSLADLAGRSPIQWATDFKAAILRTPDLRPTGEVDRYKRPTFVSHRMVERENILYHTTIPALSQPAGEPLKAEVIEQAIHAFERSRSDAQGAAFALLAFQREMVHAMASGGQNLVAYVAPAGCGKTTAARGAVDAWEEAGHRVITMAPSHSAAGQLAVDLGRNESLGIVPQSLLKKIATGKMSLTKNDVLFIDEASMVDFDTAERLVMSASQAEGGPAKVVLMGDSEQLPSVGRGNFFRKVVEQGEAAAAADKACVPYVFRVAHSAVDWTKINRQQSDIGKQATAFLATGQTSMAMDIYERLGAVRLQGTRDECLDDMVEHSMDLIATPLAKLKALQGAHSDKFANFDSMGRAAYLKASTLGGAATTRDRFFAMMSQVERPLAADWLDSLDSVKLAKTDVRAKLASTMLLATTKTEVAQLNHMARSALKEAGYIDRNTFAMVKRGRVGSMEVCEGERIVFNERMVMVDSKSRKRMRIAKSAIGTVKHIATKPGRDGAVLTLEMEGSGRTVSVDTSQFANFNYAYAMTVHKSQGMTFDHVLQLIGTFVHSQTNYVAMSRYKLSHTLFGVSSEYQTYKDKANIAQQKLEASDHGFVASNFSLTEKQARALEGDLANAKSAAQDECEPLMRYAQVAIARGILIEHGPIMDNGVASHVAKLDVFGQVVELRGPGLLDALTSIRAEAGQHVGLEPLCPSADGARDSVAWRAYTEEALNRAGIAFNEPTVAQEAQATFYGAKAMPAVLPKAYGSSELSPMLSADESLILLAKQVVRAAQVAASVVQERISQVQASQAASAWAPIAAQLDAATKCLPFAHPEQHGYLFGKVMDGISVQKTASPSAGIRRAWLAHDGDSAYCVSESGAIEAWRTQGLPEEIQREVATTTPTMASLIQARAAVRTSANDHARKPVLASFGRHAQDIDVAILEDAELGVCMGVGLRDARLLDQSPLMKKLFKDDGAPKDATKNKAPKGAIAQLKHHVGYNATLKMWMFPVARQPDGLATPKQEAAAELAALISEMIQSGEARTTEKIAPPRGRWAQAWDAIESKLNSPWGYAFAYGAYPGGTDDLPKDILGRLKDREKDIVLWNDRVSTKDAALQWQMFPNRSPSKALLTPGQHQFDGVVLHTDDEHLFVLRHQHVVAIPKTDIAATQSSTITAGDHVSILFKPGQPPQLIGTPALAPVFAECKAMPLDSIAQDITDPRMIADMDLAMSSASQSALTQDESAFGTALAWATRRKADLQRASVPQARASARDQGLAQ